MAKTPKWYKVENVAEFLSAGRKIQGTHAFTKRILHWLYCSHCGLMLLKNARSQKLAKGPCIQLED